jgi:phosphomannomutase/phosphoglucomutase
VKPEIVTGHDFRGYSSSIKMALVTGLMAAGCKVHDIGLCMSPMAYFAQFALDVPCVAMVTASHNDNGWTGVKMGCHRPVTFGPEEMGQLRTSCWPADFDLVGGGSYQFVPDFPAIYIGPDRPAEDQAQAEGRRRLRQRHRRRLRAADPGGARLRGDPAGCRARPHLPALQSQSRRHEDAARHGRRCEAAWRRCRLGFDGDGDRCGVVDNHGEEIFADKIGVMLARDLGRLHPGAQFVVDVKSTGLFDTDPVLQKLGVKTDYWKTGHSYIKRRVRDLNALAGFEKSGHFFFNAPVGRGYDDGLVTAIAVCDMLDRNPGKSMADLYRGRAQDLGHADHVAAMRRRDQVRRRRGW